MSGLRSIIEEIRAVSHTSLRDVDLLRRIGEACDDMQRDRDKSRQREWRDEIVARVCARLPEEVQ